MGIRGLSSYVQERSSKLLKPYELHNQPLVVDGNNLMFFALLSCRRHNCCFGGDYNILAEHVRDILRLFKKCRVDLVVVFDGGLDVGGRKAAERMERSRRKLIASLKVLPSNQHRMSVLPLLFTIVFRDVLEEFGVQVIQHYCEADAEIAALARGLQCPVLSNDSDFYVVDVRVIPLTSVDFSGPKKTSTGQNFIDCRVFEMETFLKSIGHENSSVLPLLGTLLGNDYADSRLFDNILNQISKPKNKSLSDQHRKLQGLVDWLRGRSVQDAIDKMMDCVKKEDRTRVEVAIRTSLKAYEDENTNSQMTPQSLTDKITAWLMTEAHLPEHFAFEYSRGRLCSWTLQLLMDRELVYQSQIESSYLPSSFQCCRPLLKALMTILIPGPKSRIKILCRQESKLVHRSVTANATNHPALPKLSSVTLPAPTEVQQGLLELLVGVENVGSLQAAVPGPLVLLVAIIAFWTRNTTSCVKSFHVDALVATILNVSIIERKVGSRKKLTSTPADKIPAEDHHCWHAARQTWHWNEPNARTMSHDVDYDRSVVHSFSEFQACYYYARMVNRMLGDPCELSSPALFYCGTFLYGTAKHFQKGGDRDQVLDKLYGQGSPLADLLRRIVLVVSSMAPAGFDSWPGSNGAKKAKRKMKNKNQLRQHVVDEDEDEIGENSEDEFDLLDNRFRLLTV